MRKEQIFYNGIITIIGLTILFNQLDGGASSFALNLMSAVAVECGLYFFSILISDKDDKTEDAKPINGAQDGNRNP